MGSVLRFTIAGCGDLPGYGEHPGTPFLILMVGAGAVAGSHNGFMAALIGAGAMLAVFGPMFLIGAYGRGRAFSSATRSVGRGPGTNTETGDA